MDFPRQFRGQVLFTMFLLHWKSRVNSIFTLDSLMFLMTKMDQGLLVF